MFGFILGGVYLAIGAAGYLVTMGVKLTSTSGGKLLESFEVNPLHNAAHLVIGGALLLAALAGPRVSISINAMVGAAYLALGVIGWFFLNSSANILALNAPDNLLHIGTGALALGVAVVLGKRDPIGARSFAR